MHRGTGGTNSRSTHRQTNYPQNTSRERTQMDTAANTTPPVNSAPSNLTPVPEPVPTSDSSSSQPVQVNPTNSQPVPNDTPPDKPVEKPQEVDPIDGSIITQDKVESIGTSDNMRILYITIAIIIGLLLLWLLIMFFTKDDPIRVLNDMIDPATQIKPVSDLQPAISSITSTISDMPI